MSETTVTCNHCGECVPKKRFCLECGAVLTIRSASQSATRQGDRISAKRDKMSETTITCNYCGECVPKKRFCLECGAVLTIRSASQSATRQGDGLFGSPVQVTVSERRVLDSGTAGSPGMPNVDDGGTSAKNVTDSKANKKV